MTRNWIPISLVLTALAGACQMLTGNRTSAEDRVVASAEGPAILAVSSGQKPLPGSLPPTETKLRLKGSRGETLNFMLEIKPGACAPLGLGLSVDGVSPKLRLYEMQTIQVEHPSYPKAPLGQEFDPLMPVELSNVCPTAGPRTWFWGELEIPENMKPGTYSSVLKHGTEKLPFELTVWKMKIPAQYALPAYSGLSSWYLLLGHHGKWAQGEEVLAGKYAEEMYRHRLIPIQAFVAKPEISDGKLDLDSKPTRAQSFNAVVLKSRPKWAYFDFPTIPPDDIDKPSTPQYFKAVQNTLAQTGRPDRAFVYLWDEPVPEALGALTKLAKIAKTSAPGLKVMVTTVPKPALNPYVDIYVPVMDQYGVRGFPSEADYKELRKSGKEIWWYISCMSHGCDALLDSGRPDLVIDRPASYVRSISWISSKYAVDAFLYYTPVEAYRHYPDKDPWKTVWLFSGNGDGTLFYPGRPGERGFTEHRPVTSIRLKLWRESSFDAEYIRWMNERKDAPDWWKAEYGQIVKSTTDWDRDYVKYQSLRDRAGDYLNGLGESKP